MTKTHSLAGSNALESVVNGANLISPAGSHTQIIASMSLIAMSSIGIFSMSSSLIYEWEKPPMMWIVNSSSSSNRQGQPQLISRWHKLLSARARAPVCPLESTEELLSLSAANNSSYWSEWRASPTRRNASLFSQWL